MSNNIREREFDIVIFGATGLTGQYSIRALIQSMTEKENATIRWAVASRNLDKLEQTLKEIGKDLNQNDDDNDIFANVGRIRADVGDVDSIDSMVRRTTVLVNTVGPYTKYGPPVVAACVRYQTHHLDISAETLYIGKTVLLHDQAARENNTIIIPACGFDCVPTDMGVHYLKRAFDGILTTAETYGTYAPSPEGYPINKGTFNSGILFFHDLIPTFRTRMKLANKGKSVSKPQPNNTTNQPKLRLRILPFRRPEFDGINILMPSEDKPLILRTQRYMLENYGEPPVKVQTYFTFQTIIALIKLSLFIMVLAPLMLFGAGRRFLSRNIDQVTLGYFSRNGPNERQIAGTNFTYRIVGQGWAAGKPIDAKRRPNETMIAVVTGPDPAYRATCAFLVEAALTIIAERDTYGYLVVVSSRRQVLFVTPNISIDWRNMTSSLRYLRIQTR